MKLPQHRWSYKNSGENFADDSGLVKPLEQIPNQMRSPQKGEQRNKE